MKKWLTLMLLAPVALAIPRLAASPAASPGVVFTMEVKDVGSSEPAQQVTASIEGELLKVQSAAEGGGQPNEVIFRGDRNELVMVDHGSRTYVVMDEAAMKQLVSQLGAAMSQMQEMLKTMPPEQRAQMEEMMKGRGMGPGMGAAPEPTELRRTSERAEQSGYPSVKYEILQGGRKVREMWITEWTNVPGAAEARPAFERMAAFAKEMMDALAQTGFGGGADLDVYQHMQEANGYPVVAIEFDDNGQPETETRLVSATEQTIQASAFEPPDGYRRQSMGGMGG